MARKARRLVRSVVRRVREAPGLAEEGLPVSDNAILGVIRHDTKVKASQLKRCSSAYSYCYEVRMSVEEGQTPVGKDPRVGVENEKLSISRFPLRHNPVQVFCI